MVWLKKVLKTVRGWITWPYYRIKEEIKFRKRIKELRKKDPFIYK